MVAVCSANGPRKNRAHMKAPITVEDVLKNSRNIAYPFRHPAVLPRHHGGGALILTSADAPRIQDQAGLYPCQARGGTPMVSQMQTFDSSPRSGSAAARLQEPASPMGCRPPDDLPTRFAHLPLYGLGDLGFMPHEETASSLPTATPDPRQAAAEYIRGGPDTCIPACTACMPCRKRGANARDRAGASAGAKISVCHGVGGMFGRAARLFLQRTVNFRHPGCALAQPGNPTPDRG